MDDPPPYQSSWNGKPDQTGVRPRVGPERRQRSFYKLIRNWSQGDGRRTTERNQGSTTQGIPSWKPVTLRAPVLLSMILLTAFLIVALQTLLSKSQRAGGITFPPDLEKVPLSTSFAYLYLPTVIAVIYSMLWSWIDLDAKRLEPYFQLSRDEGVSADDSLLLHYPFDFIAFVPIKSIKRGHWSVFCASTAMVLVFWGITPFQSGIFATNTITLRESIPLWFSNSSASTTTQAPSSSVEYQYSVFGILWLNETLPPFMTREYALTPFSTTKRQEPRNTEIWTARTQLYSMDLDCDLAIVQDSAPRPGFAESSTNRAYLGRGCKVDEVGSDIDISAEYAAFYAGYHNNQWADYYLSSSCSKNASHVFFVRWTKTRRNASEERGEAAALFCEPKYYYQDVNASIYAYDGKVNRTSALGPKLPLPEGLFNATTFETELSSGAHVLWDRDELPTGLMPDNKNHLKNMDFKTPSDMRMIGYAIAVEKRAPADYLDPKVLKSSFQSAYRLLFARYLTDALKSKSTEHTLGLGERTYSTGSVIVIPTFAYLVEGLLGTTALLAAVLLYIHLRKPRKLVGDPAAIATIMSLVADSRELPNHFSGSEYSSQKKFEKSLQGKRFRLAKTNDNRGCCLEVIDSRLNTGDASNGLGSLSKFKKRAPEDGSSLQDLPSPVRPIEMRLCSAVVFITILLSLLVGIATLQSRIHTLNGLPRPSSNRVIRQIILNYIPTAVATFLEPAWIVLNRLLCILQPFEELRRGKGTSSASLSSTYTSLPPQLVFWKAVRSKHYILTAVCSMALLANLLAVSLSGLFFEGTISKPTSSSFAQPYAPIFRSFRNTDRPFITTPTDPFLVARTNIKLNTPMPSWTTDDQFFLPFSLQSKGGQHFRASTSTFSLQMNCIQLHSEPPNSVSFTLKGKESPFPLLVNMTRGNGKSVLCQPRLDAGLNITRPGPSSSEPNGVLVQAKPNGVVATELSFAMDSFGDNNITVEEKDFCQELIVSGWVRANVSTTGDGKSGFDSDVLSSNQMFMGCRPSLRTGISEVVVDDQGHVLHTSQPKALNDSFEKHFTSRPTDLYGQIAQTLATALPHWHNDSFPSDWANYLMRHMYNTTAMLDPQRPVPTFDTVVPRIQALNAKLFAIVLGTTTDVLFAPSNGSQVQGQVLEPTPRVFISKPMFIISQTILAMYVVVAVTMYVFGRPSKFLPRLPTTIASVISFVYESHALADFKGTAQMPPKERKEHLDSLGNRYGYGRYVGTDGQVHIGIERQPLLVDLDQKTNIGGGWI